jgi:hypothetical protein
VFPSLVEEQAHQFEVDGIPQGPVGYGGTHRVADRIARCRGPLAGGGRRVRLVHRVRAGSDGCLVGRLGGTGRLGAR